MKKRGIILALSMISAMSILGQGQLNSDGKDKPSTPEKKADFRIKSWNVNEQLGEVNNIPMDTLTRNYQNRTVLDGTPFSRGHLGTLGSAGYSRSFTEENGAQPSFLFIKPFQSYMMSPSNTLFYNTTIPFSNITFFQSGNKENGEERFGGLFTVNAGKKINFGGDVDMVYSRGYYNNQSAKHTNYRVFGSYQSDRYSLHAALMSSNINSKENGGISDDRYITAPEEVQEGNRVVEPKNIPTNLESNYNRVILDSYFLTHRYNLGYEKDVVKKLTEDTDTTIVEFVPVSSIIHTAKFEKGFKRYVMDKAPLTEGYYDNFYFNENQFRDFTRFWSLSNTLALSLREGFNRFMKFGATGFVEHRVESYSLMDYSTFTKDSTTRLNDVNTTVENTLFVGGALSRTEGSLLNFNVNGKFGVVGADMGEVEINGDIKSSFNIARQRAYVYGFAQFLNMAPNYYHNKWVSNNYIWNNDFGFEQRVRFGGEIGIPTLDLKLRASVDNISNHIYFGSRGTPVQEEGSVQVLNATLSKNFSYKALHLENNITYQSSSKQSVISVPQLMLYHNFFVEATLARVLKLQIGVDLRYHTSYYAPDYNPAISQFVQQQDIKVGNYPIMNAYVNAKLKTVRFFVMVTHLNEGLFGERNYFSSPHYPINPRAFKLGLCWNFLD
ncbi:MAG: putative porin [Bacteroidales bacterium]